MDVNEPLPQEPSLDVDNESEEERDTPLSPSSSPDGGRCIGLNPFCLHEQLEAFCSQEFGRRKHFVRHKLYDEFPTLDPSLETAQATTITRVVEEKKILGKVKKKALREKKKAEKSKSGSTDVIRDPRLLPHRARTAPRTGSDSSKPSTPPNPILDISKEEIVNLMKRLKIVPKRLPKPCERNEASKFFVPEYDTMFKISYCGHHEAYGDYDLQNVQENLKAFEDIMLGVEEYLVQYFPSSEQMCQTATASKDHNSNNTEEEKERVTRVQMDELFNLSSNSHKTQSSVPPKVRDEECEPEEDRYLRYQRAQIVKFLKKARADYVTIEKEQIMKEEEMLKQIELAAERQSNSHVFAIK